MDDFAHLDYYQLLQLDRNASVDEIKRAYRREISKYHPDRFATAPADQQAYAQLRSQRLTEAYTALSDFASRSAYNRGEPAPRRTMRPTHPATPAEPTEPQPRDYQAELYTQAQDHMHAGRLLQAAAVLRQLQQINPFYPNSAALLSRVEGQLAAQQPVAAATERTAPPRVAIIGAGLAGAALVGAAIWAISQQGSTASAPARTAAPVAIAATALSATVPPAPTAAPLPSPSAVQASTTVPATAVPATAAPATAAPATAAPTVTAAPTATETSIPVQAEGGALVLDDSFGGDGWASLNGTGWSVGYINSGYQIAVDPGVGAIWSYRSGLPTNASIGVDIFNVSGAGGLLLRFVDNDNFLSYTITSASQSYQVTQQVAGETLSLANDTSTAIRSGDTNRIVARLTGTTLQLFANDTLLEAVDISAAPASSRYGLVAVSGAGPADIRFDNLSIRTARE